MATLEVSRRRGRRQAGWRWPGRVPARCGHALVLLARRKTTGEGASRAGPHSVGPAGGAR